MSTGRIYAGIGALALIIGLTTTSGSAATANGPNVAGSGSTASELHSSNWAGYVTTGGGTSASANWVVPSVYGAGGYSSSWAGVDGYGLPTVEQTGTASGLLFGVPVYSAWVELYPAPPATLQTAFGADAPVRPGDHMSGSVKANGDRYTIKLTDHTQGWKFAWTVAAPSGMNASAEVITEAPTGSAGILPLHEYTEHPERRAPSRHRRDMGDLVHELSTKTRVILAVVLGFIIMVVIPSAAFSGGGSSSGGGSQSATYNSGYAFGDATGTPNSPASEVMTNGNFWGNGSYTTESAGLDSIGPVGLNIGIDPRCQPMSCHPPSAVPRGTTTLRTLTGRTDAWLA